MSDPVPTPTYRRSHAAPPPLPHPTARVHTSSHQDPVRHLPLQLLLGRRPRTALGGMVPGLAGCSGRDRVEGARPRRRLEGVEGCVPGQGRQGVGRPRLFSQFFLERRCGGAVVWTEGGRIAAPDIEAKAHGSRCKQCSSWASGLCWPTRLDGWADGIHLKLHLACHAPFRPSKWGHTCCRLQRGTGGLDKVDDSAEAMLGHDPVADGMAARFGSCDPHDGRPTDGRRGYTQA